MWGLLYCCVTLAIANPLWVQALPTNITFDKIKTNHVDIKPSECPENEFFNHEGKACELTCELPVLQNRCNEEKVAACECSTGYVRNGTGVCVTLVQCYDNFNILYNIVYNVPESTSHKVIVEEFTSTLDEIQSTNKTNVTSVITYDTDEYKDSHKIPSSFHPLSKFEIGLVIYSVLDRQLQEEILMILHNIHDQGYDTEESVNPESDQQYLIELLRKKVKEELDSFKNSDDYEENEYFSF